MTDHLLWFHLPCGTIYYYAPTLFIKTPYFCVGDLGSVPGFGRSPGEGKGYPLQYSGLENFMDCIVHGVTKSQTWLSDFHFSLSFLLLIKHQAPAYSHFYVLFFTLNVLSESVIPLHKKSSVCFRRIFHLTLSPMEKKIVKSVSLSVVWNSILCINYRVFWVKMLPQWPSSKESACNAADAGLIPGWGGSPGVGSGNPLQCSCWENPTDRGV